MIDPSHHLSPNHRNDLLTGFPTANLSPTAPHFLPPQNSQEWSINTKDRDIYFISPGHRTQNEVCLTVTLSVLSERMNSHLPYPPTAAFPSHRKEPQILTNSYDALHQASLTSYPYSLCSRLTDLWYSSSSPNSFPPWSCFYTLCLDTPALMPGSFSSFRSQSNATSSGRPSLPSSTHTISPAPFSSQYLTSAELSC